MIMNHIVGEKIYLRPITSEDTSNIVKWRNTDFVRDNFIFRESFTEEMHLNWLKSKVDTGKVVQFIICLNNGTPIGSVYYRDIDSSSKSAEFGIFIGEPAALGMGYGFEATSLFVKYGFELLGFEKITLRVINANHRATYVYKKAGFTVLFSEEEISQPSGESVSVTFMEIHNSK